MIPSGGAEGTLIQDDQMGRPAINTVFNHGPAKDLFNVTAPADQPASFSDVDLATRLTGTH